MYEPEETPSFLSRYGVAIGVAAGLVLVVVIAVIALGLLGGGGGDNNASASDSPTAAPSPTVAGSNEAEVALGQYVATTLQQTYAGDCSGVAVNPATSPTPAVTDTPATAETPAAGATTRPSTPGSVCSTKRGERQGVEAYVLGQPLSEPTQWAFLQQKNGAWQVVYAPKITDVNQTVPGTPWPLATGAEVIVIAKPDPCLNVHEGPALAQAAVDCIADGAQIKLAAGPTDADGFQWWQVEGRSGWVVADFLRYPDAAQ